MVKTYKNNWRIWLLVDAKGNILAYGKKSEVERAGYPRYVYGHIFTDTLIQTRYFLQDIDIVKKEDLMVSMNAWREHQKEREA